ncbi:hypothetical protein DFH07DRAFT_779515 [Mycena maculata]|uniref:Uncharacterized protein n=1 Tax=Mycena maculata TaxID=230809 RepID=A0AAD7I955_9AGAR|nr:hypothetical protein DFH07DRAFT_779515 [Mycena maculata]
MSAGRLYATPLGLVVRCFSASDMLESDLPRNAGVFMRSTMRRKPALTALHRFRPPPASHDHSDDTLRSVEDRIVSSRPPINLIWGRIQVLDGFHSTHESNMLPSSTSTPFTTSIDVVRRNDNGRQGDGGTVQ